MRASSRPRITSLPRHVSLGLQRHAGDRIECVSGTVWVTQDGDLRDIVLKAGESFRLDRTGRALVSALADAGVILHAAKRPRLAARVARAVVTGRAWVAQVAATLHARPRSAA
jgi:hypothetical protein